MASKNELTKITMSYFERYLRGETKTVYDDIEKLGQDAFLPENYTEIEAVLIETFRRTNVNLKVIYRELQRINYQFKTDFACNSDRPLIKPLPNKEELIEELDKVVKPFGFVPLSLKLFYEIVGACNFAWDYESNEELYWGDYSWGSCDPLQIISADDLLSFIVNEDWQEYMKEILSENVSEVPYLELATDYCHKDNVSGGLPYSIEITKSPSIDSLFLHEPHSTTFIDYLRICFENCGFPGIYRTAIEDDHKSFFSRVKPQMLKI